MFLNGEWLDTQDISGQKYTCGHCGTETASSGGYVLQRMNKDGFYDDGSYILICTACNQPTFLLSDLGIQIPNSKVVTNIEHLPGSLGKLYSETREAISSGLFNSTVLLCRKMLMNLAVLEGAEENKTFAYYVDYIETNGYITVKMKPWVDKIRLIGNTATHEIPDINKEDAYNAFEFLVMLLKLVYEFPAKMQS
ncbi:DUF4145 domain-containing protein [Fictibacillus sp. 5RED26]|uniref:DUF4145 domain-containing protein n=1 Tax=Fictibacillus sp. 5RED26 TaxID=2745876 RepID=UPI0018CE48ED|nr:DUF4145 domain-containing protein [Fictibacillus sp. 5RED26]MBH0156780.1 DUF4145 domain-containing protein [Fictibacillus sp. 5RED26]